MSFKDIIKKSVLENFASAGFTTKELIVLLLLATAIGIGIFFVYKFLSKNEFYSKSFGVNLIILTIITATIIITIQSSLVVSLGMVGALSIVRFRTAVKNPLDLGFVFWAISAGIVIGANLPLIAFIVSVVITIVLFVFMAVPGGKKSVLVHVSGVASESDVEAVLSELSSKCTIKSQGFANGKSNYLFEVKTKSPEKILDTMKTVAGVESVSVIDNAEKQF